MDLLLRKDYLLPMNGSPRSNVNCSDNCSSLRSVRTLPNDRLPIASKLASVGLRVSPSLRSVGTSWDDNLANSSKCEGKGIQACLKSPMSGFLEITNEWL